MMIERDKAKGGHKTGKMKGKKERR